MKVNRRSLPSLPAVAAITGAAGRALHCQRCESKLLNSAVRDIVVYDRPPIGKFVVGFQHRKLTLASLPAPQPEYRQRRYLSLSCETGEAL
jgi:hypothetical protein